MNLRTRWLRSPLGDQAQFASRAAFEELGGYPEWPILEDLEFIRRLKRLGRVTILAPAVSTSARRFEDEGIARTLLRNWLIFALYYAGVSPRTSRPLVSGRPLGDRAIQPFWAGRPTPRGGAGPTGLG